MNNQTVETKLLQEFPFLEAEQTIENDGTTKLKITFSMPDKSNQDIHILSRLINYIYEFNKKPIMIDYVNGNSFVSLSFGDNINISISLYGAINTILIKKKKKKFSEVEENFLLNTLIHIFEHIYKKEKSSIEDELAKLGVIIYKENDIEISGYKDIQEKIYENVIYPMKFRNIFSEIPKLTRVRYGTILPKAILFEGPPGVGKTLFSRFISKELNYPLIYIPVEGIISKWYGESAKNLSIVFEKILLFQEAIVFFDEIDAFATSREKGIHEATRRMLSVLLRNLDKLEERENILIIGATNRKEDLDHALISRFDITITFHLPGENDRSSLFNFYAKHLKKEEVERLSKMTKGLSCRDIKEICEIAERSWGYNIIKNKQAKISPPPIEFYEKAIEIKKSSLSTKTSF